MESSELAELTTDPIQKLGLGFYFDPLTAERAKELGMNVFEFYGLGRGGVLGDVDAEVVDRAFTFFHPRTMDFLFHRARAKADPVATAREHVLARRCDGVGLGARTVEEEIHRPGVKERERAVDDLGVNVTEHATSTKAVELEDVHPEFLGALGGERIEVEAEAQLLDRIGRQF